VDGFLLPPRAEHEEANNDWGKGMELRESLLSRRDYLTGLIIGSLGALLAFAGIPVSGFLFHKKKIPLPKAVTVSLAEVEKIAPNSAVYFPYGRMPGILLKTETGDLRAFSAKCTHLDCNVQYMADEKKFFCACHDGYFDDMGNNIAGPPPSPLPEFDMIEEDGLLVITYSEDDTKHA
jgi:Rieske Fe-S protein